MIQKYINKFMFESDEKQGLINYAIVLSILLMCLVVLFIII